MRFSIWPTTKRPWSEIIELARHCEAAGWDGVYLADHFMPHGDFTPDVDQEAPLDGDVLECWSALAALATAVPRLRLGTLVTSVTYRHPAVLANIAATVDQISNGRLVLGVGAGWQLNEHASYGLALGSIADRFDRLEEACQVITSLLRQRRTTFSGRFYQLRDAPNQPVPVQERLPLLIGGGGEKRTLPLAARYADEWNYWGTPPVLARKVQMLHGHCEALGRDPREIRVSTQALLFLSTDQARLAEMRAVAPADRAIVGTPSELADIVARYREAGVDEVVVPDATLGALPAAKEVCDLFIEEVAAHFRA